MQWREASGRLRAGGSPNGGRESCGRRPSGRAACQARTRPELVERSCLRHDQQSLRRVRRTGLAPGVGGGQRPRRLVVRVGRGPGGASSTAAAATQATASRARPAARSSSAATSSSNPEVPRARCRRADQGRLQACCSASARCTLRRSSWRRGPVNREPGQRMTEPHLAIKRYQPGPRRRGQRPRRSRRAGRPRAAPA